MTFNPARKPGGTPGGGQFTAPSFSEPDLILETYTCAPSAEAQQAAYEERLKLGWEKTLARRIAQKEQQPKEALNGTSAETGQEPLDAFTPEPQKGPAGRALDAVEGFSDFVEANHNRDMAELHGTFMNWREMLPKFLRKR